MKLVARPVDDIVLRAGLDDGRPLFLREALLVVIFRRGAIAVVRLGRRVGVGGHPGDVVLYCLVAGGELGNTSAGGMQEPTI